MTAAAGDLKWDDDPVSHAEVSRFRADFADDSHGFVTEDVPRFHEGTENFVEMEI
jgi:hypothetical protein